MYRLLQKSAFGPDDIKRLTADYESTLRVLELSDRNDPITEIVARRIIEAAQLASAIRDSSGDLIVGLIGAFIGDWLLPRLGIHLGTGIVALVINAFVGAVVLLLILRLVSGWRGGTRWGQR